MVSKDYELTKRNMFNSVWDSNKEFNHILNDQDKINELRKRNTELIEELNDLKKEAFLTTTKLKKCYLENKELRIKISELETNQSCHDNDKYVFYLTTPVGDTHKVDIINQSHDFRVILTEKHHSFFSLEKSQEIVHKFSELYTGSCAKLTFKKGN